LNIDVKSLLPRPRILLGLFLFSGAWGAILSVLLILVVAGIGSFRFENSYLTGHEVLQRFGLRMGLLDFAMLSTALGIATKGRWVRPAIIVWLLGFGLSPYFVPTPAWTPAPGLAPLMLTLSPPALAAWYLYFTDGARDHFDSKS